MIYYLYLSNIWLELIGEYSWQVDEHHDVAALKEDKKNEEKGSSMFNDSNLDKWSDIKSLSSVKNLRHQFVHFVNSKTPNNLFMIIIVNAVIIIIIILMLFFLNSSRSQWMQTDNRPAAFSADSSTDEHSYLQW